MSGCRVNGFAYIALLISLSVIMLILTAASENIAQNAKREKEQQLFFVGKQFRDAIASYYNTGSSSGNYPQSLQQLIKDERSPNVTRHLRKIYLDPMTNSFDWGLVVNEQQRIVGVYSLSREHVLKTNFDNSLVQTDLGSLPLVYSDLKFIYKPQKKPNR